MFYHDRKLPPLSAAKTGKITWLIRQRARLDNKAKLVKAITCRI